MELQLLGFPGEEIRPNESLWVRRYLCEVLPGKWAMMWHNGPRCMLGFYTTSYVRTNVRGLKPGDQLAEVVDVECPLQASALIHDFIQRNSSSNTENDNGGQEQG